MALNVIRKSKYSISVGEHVRENVKPPTLKKKLIKLIKL